MNNLDTLTINNLLDKESFALGEKDDCAVRAVAALGDYTYSDIHYVFELMGRKHKKGTPTHITKKTLGMLGYTYTDYTDYYIDSGGKTIRSLMPILDRTKKYLIRIVCHIMCVNNGMLVDTRQNRLHRIKTVWEINENPSWNEAILVKN